MPGPLYLITDRSLCREQNLPDAVERALQGGVSLVQLREKDLADKDLLELAGALRRITARAEVPLLINGRVDIALAVRADGVHLSPATPGLDRARERLGPQALIGFSAHSIEEIRLAERIDADFVTFSPIYPTPSKSAFGPPLGIEALREACAQTELPVYALGGITAGRLAEIRPAGAAGFACIRALLAADDPRHAAERLLAAWRLAG